MGLPSEDYTIIPSFNAPELFFSTYYLYVALSILPQMEELYNCSCYYFNCSYSHFAATGNTVELSYIIKMEIRILNVYIHNSGTYFKIVY